MQEKNPSTNDSGAPGHEMLDQKKHEFDSRTYKIPQNTEVSSSMHVSDIDSNMNPNEQFTKAYIENNISDDNSNNASGQNNEPGQADNSYKNDFNAICTTLKKMKEDFENKFTNINDRFDQLEGNLEERIAMLQSDSKSTLKLMIDKVHSDLKIAIIDSISSSIFSAIFFSSVSLDLATNSKNTFFARFKTELTAWPWKLKDESNSNLIDLKYDLKWGSNFPISPIELIPRIAP